MSITVVSLHKELCKFWFLGILLGYEERMAKNKRATTERLVIEVTPELMQELRDHCTVHRQSFREFVTELLVGALEKASNDKTS